MSRLAELMGGRALSHHFPFEDGFGLTSKGYGSVLLALRKRSFGSAVTTVTMANAAVTLVTGTTPASGQASLIGNIVVVDPGGIGVPTLTLPAVTEIVGVPLLFANSADSAEDFVVKNDGGSTIITLSRGQSGIVLNNGVTYYGFTGTLGGADDFGAPGIKTDVVAESTAAAGVAVDGALLKDGGATLKDSTTWIADEADPTKKFAFQVSGLTTGANRTLSVPDFNADGGLFVRRASATIQAAAVATMNATPVVMLAAPGPGQYIEVLSIHWWLDFGTTQYNAADAGDVLTAKYNNGSGAAVVDAVAGNVIGGAVADYHVVVQPAAELVPVDNVPIVAHIGVGEWYTGAGDSSLKWEMFYRIRQFEF